MAVVMSQQVYSQQVGVVYSAHLLRMLADVLSLKQQGKYLHYNNSFFHALSLLVCVYCYCILINWCACYHYNLQRRVVPVAVVR